MWWLAQMGWDCSSASWSHGGRMCPHHHSGLRSGLLGCLLPGVPLVQERCAGEDAKRHERGDDDGCGTSGHVKVLERLLKSSTAMTPKAASDR